MLWQPPIDDKYLKMSREQLAEAIDARRAQLGDKLVILGHHYQADDVVAHADFLGDSFKLSQLAAQKVQEVGSKYVMFLGVHFMAESADILTPDEVSVILPDLSAGCSMADMAAYDDVVDAWEQIHEVLDETEAAHRVIPVTYMNSSAAIKAFVGAHGGAVCTSSNARAVLEWAFAGGTQPKRDDEDIKVMFFPDQHLGRNTAAAMGYDIDTDMTLWDPRSPMPMGGSSEDAIARSSVILWKGHCSVHKLFRPEHVDEIKAREPDTTVIVHPECEYAVVQRADLSGSTEAIMKAVQGAEPGSKWAVGTEVHMVNRLAREAAERGVDVRILSDCQCLCTTMYRIDPPHMLMALDELVEGRVVNRITVDEKTREWSLVALQRMLDITGSGVPIAPDPTPAVAD